ncbi:Wzz/FepE/Etk N-terminal domain-containing protein [Sulfitobacter sp.]|nr:Wzz/FepE/Etk N-terminal domain-containing protein [Sulfitobacter sp.]
MPNYELGKNVSDEIDLKELFLALWAYKYLIAALSIFVSIAAGIYALRAEKVYTANTIFSLGESKNDGGILGSLGGQLGGLVALAGVKTDSGEALVERFRSRDFILEVAADLNLKNDKMFNSYSPNSQTPNWKASLKAVLGLQSATEDPVNMENWSIVSSYANLVKIEQTDSGPITISVKHTAPERAAQIANFLASKIILVLGQENEESVDKKLEYLSRILADALQDLEKAQSALKQYSLENSTQAFESFAVGSVMLDEMRVQRETSAEDLAAIEALKLFLVTDKTTLNDYQELRQSFPEIDQSGFRRIMGLSEVTTAWTWPSIGTVLQVEASVRERLASLDREILKLSDDALRYASSAEELAQLQRKLKISEAAYTVLIEQVKTQSLVAGFQPDSSKIFALADVPISATEPKKSLIVALGLVLGLFGSAALALVLILRRGVYFSLSNLLGAVGADSAHSLGKLKHLKKEKDIISVQKKLVKSPINWARQTVLELEVQEGARPVFLCDLSLNNRGGVLGRIIAATAGNLGRTAALIDLSRVALKSDQLLGLESENELVRVEEGEGCSEYAYVCQGRNLDMLYSKKFKTIVAGLFEKHDIVIFSVNDDDMETVQASSGVDELNVIASVKPGKTKHTSLQNLLKRSKVGVVLYG